MSKYYITQYTLTINTHNTVVVGTSQYRLLCSIWKEAVNVASIFWAAFAFVFVFHGFLKNMHQNNVAKVLFCLHNLDEKAFITL